MLLASTGNLRSVWRADCGARTAFVQLASLVHQLRFPDGCEPLSLPLPLHLVKLAAEYV